MLRDLWLSRVAYALARVVLPGGRWRYRGTGRCPSCGERTIFVLSASHARWIEQLIKGWANSATFKRGLVERESELCALCHANFRVRAQAETALEILEASDVRSLLERLNSSSPSSIYETAQRNVFRLAALQSHSSYVNSEYLDAAQPGEIVDGVMHQNLERLTFADDTFDLVLTSEVLEHVADLGRALLEIRRVLKPGGYHVFTVPSDPDLPRTVERARVVDGSIVHLAPPIMHGDSIRKGGILAFRDFGRDAADVLSLPGMPCSERTFSGDSGFVSSVFVGRKDDRA